MKTSSKILLGVTGFALLVLVVLFATPQTLVDEQTVYVGASAATVRDQVRYFERYPAWSPWKEQDPGQKITVEGTDGEIGVTYSWVGDQEVSKGYQELVDLRSNGAVIDCHISAPFESHPQFTYRFEPLANGTNVYLRFETRLPIPMNVISQVIGLSKQIHTVNAKALSNLKNTCEQQASLQH